MWNGHLCLISCRVYVSRKIINDYVFVLPDVRSYFVVAVVVALWWLAFHFKPDCLAIWYCVHWSYFLGSISLQWQKLHLMNCSCYIEKKNKTKNETKHRDRSLYILRVNRWFCKKKIVGFVHLLRILPLLFVYFVTVNGSVFLFLLLLLKQYKTIALKCQTYYFNFQHSLYMLWQSFGANKYCP